ncbi:hypothetical protein [Rhizobacter sp. OV335]|uniref:hypothetical protein n=1 Tax=Rhizobacter sp. OV335 TaxID=1500264 RepID=UPI001160E299|nr:hypothetical protein [Rhizobacter sp. OV335]
MTSTNHTHLHGPVVLRNLTSGAPWQAEFFELDAEKSSIRRLPENVSNKGKAVGFGSKAIAFSGGQTLWNISGSIFCRE